MIQSTLIFDTSLAGAPEKKYNKNIWMGQCRKEQLEDSNLKISYLLSK